jgi:hypothetical protein
MIIAEVLRVLLVKESWPSWILLLLQLYVEDRLIILAI